MSSFTCPDCEDGTLEAKVREVNLELRDGETVEIVGGVVLVTSVGCNNGCDSHEEKPPKGQKKKKKGHAPAAAGGEQCEKSEDCDKENGHKYRCNSNRSAETAGV